MVVRYGLAGGDLAGVRFAISPLNEVVLSLRSWRDPGRYPLHLPWQRLTQAVRSTLDSELLLALTNEALWTPDFLSPWPASPLTRFEDELEIVAGTDPVTVARDLRVVHEHRPAPLRGRRVLERVTTALRAYWQACFLPWWPRMRAVLEGDVTYRGRVSAQRGLGAMFADLSPAVSLRDDVVEVRLNTRVDYARDAAGGLTLVPTMFTTTVSAPISANYPPVIMYLARGVGTLWEARPLAAPGAALVGLLGTVRAGLLARLATPASSTELAVGLGVTTAAVNQHLRALRAAGLLVSARHGRSVLYRRSELGDRLLGPTG